MNELADLILKRVKARVVMAVRLAVDIAQATGLPAKIMSRIFPDGSCCCHPHEEAEPAAYVPSAAVTAHPPSAAPHPAAKKSASSARRKKTGSRRVKSVANGTAVATPLPQGVRPLKRKDMLDGSTYLARIVWCLGVSAREGTGPLRPADIARMVLTRSPVTLEPPNIARYIRRARPEAIVVSRSERGSNFYTLSPAGNRLFEATFLA